MRSRGFPVDFRVILEIQFAFRRVISCTYALPRAVLKGEMGFAVGGHEFLARLGLKGYTGGMDLDQRPRGLPSTGTCSVISTALSEYMRDAF